MRSHLTIAALALLFALVRSQPVRIGRLSELAHEVSGEVWAIDQRTLELRDLTYDGTGPKAFFWVGKGSPNSDGFAVPFLPDCGQVILPAYNRATVRVELPGSTTLKDIDYLSLWCEQVDQDFGNVIIPDSVKNSAPAATGAPKCQSGTFPVKDGWNCEQFTSLYQMRWRTSGANIDFELVSKITTDEWMSFGVSGVQTRSQMVNGDVVIATDNGGSPSVVDYFMNSQAQCSAGQGVCRDTVQNGGDDLNSITGKRDRDTLFVSYSRPAAANEATDRAFRLTPGEQTYVIWAIGPYDSGAQVPQFHVGELSFPTGNVVFDFTRTPVDNCKTPIIAMEPKEEVVVDPWPRKAFSNVTDFTFRIGPSGGDRGAKAITGRAGWGIAWYASPTNSTGEDVLIPAIAVERGKNYTFRVFGGNNASTGADYHPLYITSDPEGGYQTKSPAARAKEVVYAGLTDVVRNETANVTGVISFTPTAFGPLCEFSNGPTTNASRAKTYEEYYNSLNRSCVESVPAAQAGVLEWSVPNDAPSVVYYQCVTHKELGFKLVVFDEGKVDLERLEAEAVDGGKRPCTALFKGTTVRFDGCHSANDDIRVLWTVRDSEIETMFVGRAEGYVGMGWGAKSMVPADAVIAYRSRNGSYVVDDFRMTAKSSAGVTVAGRQGITARDVDVQDGVISARFRRPLSGTGIATLEAGADASYIWALGSNSPNAPSLVHHSSRGSAVVNLATGVGGTTAGPGRAFFIAHGVLMAVAWAVLSPLAVVFMRFFKKYNPTTFNVHRGLNGLAVLVTVIAFIMGVVRGSKANRAHLAIGVIVTAFGLGQVVNGNLRPDKGAPRRKVWFIGHAWIGRAALVLAWVNLFLGLKLFNAAIGWWIAVGVLIGLFVLVSLGLSLFPSNFPITEELKDVADDAPNEAPVAE